MRYYLVLGLWFSMICSAWAQRQGRVDSLLNKLNTEKGNNQVNILNELSREYQILQPDKALDYGIQAMDLAKKQKYPAGVALSVRLVGEAYQSKGDFIQAQKFYYLAISLEENLKNDLGIAQCLNQIGLVYKQRGSYKEALKKYKRAVEIFEKLNNREGTARTLSHIAEVYYETAQYETAIHFATKSLDFAQEIGNIESVQEAGLVLSEAYARMGNYQEAYNFFQIQGGLKDSILLAQKRQEIRRIEARFKREKFEMEEKVRQEKANEIAKKQQQRRDSQQYALIGIIFIALFGGVSMLGKYDVPLAYKESAIFFALLMLFRFFQVMLMPFADTYSESSPLALLLANVGLALLFMPIHRVLESRLRRKVIEKPREEKAEEEKIKAQNSAKADSEKISPLKKDSKPQK